MSTPEAAPIALVAPLSEEMAVLRHRLERHGAERLDLPHLAWSARGRLAGFPVILATTGDGAERAQRGTEALLAALPVRALLALGVAGGLTPALEINDLVLGAEVVDAERNQALSPSADALALAERTTGARPALLLSTRRLALTAERKAELARDHAPGRLAAVDLESCRYAAAATAAGVPWMVMRAISDTATEALPQLLERCLDADGGIDRKRVARQLLRQPAALPRLLQMRRRVERAAERLADAAGSLLAAWSGGDGA